MTPLCEVQLEPSEPAESSWHLELSLDASLVQAEAAEARLSSDETTLQMLG